MEDERATGGEEGGGGLVLRARRRVGGAARETELDVVARKLALGMESVGRQIEPAVGLAGGSPRLSTGAPGLS